MKNCILYLGDCLEELKKIESNSIDSIVTDPPYFLSFMGLKWDSFSSPQAFQKWCEQWAIECLRVLKPGGHCLSFGGTRLYHRMVSGLEDAGFEIRDSISWVYGQGFPKSMNIGKAIDKHFGAEREVVGKREHPTLKDKTKINRQGKMQYNGENNIADEWEITAPATDDAKQWEGWGTALKPATELIVVARKPLEGRMVDNILKWGVGALNINECRIKYTETNKPIPQLAQGKTQINSTKTMFDGNSLLKSNTSAVIGGSLEGRWPANLIHDGSDEVIAMFPESSITGKRSDKSKKNIVGGTNWLSENHESKEYTDSGSVSRFFYVAKPSKKEKTENGRVNNNHPTVKPIALMQYLVKLITPKGGKVLDPFMGSGTIGCAAISEGCIFVGIEKEKESFDIAKERLDIWWKKSNGKKLVFEN